MKKPTTSKTITPRSSSKAATPFYRLFEVMSRLRAPGGCPWDRVQTHQTLKPYLIEEAYEVVEAIEAGSAPRLREELGDLLGQIIFHCLIASEAGRFDIDQAIETHIEKMVRRHPHVFSNTVVRDAKEVLLNWEEIKYREKRKERSSALDGIPRHLPALLKAHRLQDKASRLGFDWEHIDQVFAKFNEEIGEFSLACSSGDKTKIREEMGDIFFSLVNLSRFLEINPEDALRLTIDKFTRRFQYIERQLKRRKKSFKDTSLEEMDALWNESKKPQQRKIKRQSSRTP